MCRRCPSVYTPWRYGWRYRISGTWDRTRDLKERLRATMSQNRLLCRGKWRLHGACLPTLDNPKRLWLWTRRGQRDALLPRAAVPQSDAAAQRARRRPGTAGEGQGSACGRHRPQTEPSHLPTSMRLSAGHAVRVARLTLRPQHARRVYRLRLCLPSRLTLAAPFLVARLTRRAEALRRAG